MDSAATDLALGGSGAVDVTRSFSVGDPALPTSAPEEPLARHWSLAGSMSLEPSMSYSYLDVVMPDGRRLPFKRVTAGAPSPEGAVFRAVLRRWRRTIRWISHRLHRVGVGADNPRRDGAGLRPLRIAQATGLDPGCLRPYGPMGAGAGRCPRRSRLREWAVGSLRARRRRPDQRGHGPGRRHGELPLRPACRVFADVLTRVLYRRAGLAATDVSYRYQPFTGRLVAVTDGRRDRLRFSTTKPVG